MVTEKNHPIDIPDGVVSCVLIVCTYQPKSTVVLGSQKKKLNNIDNSFHFPRKSKDYIFLNGLDEKEPLV